MHKSSTWNLHLIAGLLLVVLLGIHMITTHLDLILTWFNIEKGKPGVEWANVIHRGQQISWMVFYIVFLGTALFHGLYGLRTIIFELGVKREKQKLITALFVIIWLGLFTIGTLAAITFRSVAMGA
ncbi:hypothetical protein JW979_02665 [bacterium]|nr:hypothetical protein [candidate division CSSED10-310 bacterium]